MILSENRYPPAELGCSRVLPSLMAQVGNIRLAVVKPEGRLFRDHALGIIVAVRPLRLMRRAPPAACPGAQDFAARLPPRRLRWLARDRSVGMVCVGFL